jgi:hypothetical protein
VEWDVRELPLQQLGHKGFVDRDVGRPLRSAWLAPPPWAW